MSRDSDGRYEHEKIHLSNIDLSDNSEMMPSPNQTSNGIIRIEMQPKKAVREVEPSMMAAKDTTNATVLLSKTAKPVLDYKEVSIARETFKKGSSAVKALEQTHLFSEGLIMREAENEQTGEKQMLLDLDDERGSEVCKTYLCSLERLMCSIGLVSCSKTYRNEFTNSYQVLYKQMFEQHGSRAAYLPEILDSAQEGFDHLWVNGEKYVFSDHVVESGNQLSLSFSKLREFASSFYQGHFEFVSEATGINDAELAADFCSLKEHLTHFDYMWADYERKYVGELMVIESDARRYVIESINLEAVLGQEHMQVPAMRQKFNEQRKALLQNICQVNAVANVEGKGRDDFDFALLEQSESLMETRSLSKYSRAVTRLA